MSIVYLNGEFLAQEQAKISVLDRGFLFGDGVYEVIPIFDGHFLGLNEHLSRLQRSLDAIQLQSPATPEQLKQVFHELLVRNNKTKGDHNIYLQITRGPDTTRSHAFPKTIKPTIVALCTPAKSTPRNIAKQGFSAITLDDSRRRDCHIKAITLLPNILLYEEAKKAGAIDAILIRNGEAMEGTSSNLFIVKNNELYTPPLSAYILEGITRNLIVKLAKEHHIACHETMIQEEMLASADEIWLTGSSKEICPITQLNGKSVGNGKVGPVWSQMMDYYEAHKKAARQIQ